MTLPSLAPWQPPTDYRAIESALEGVTVFAPRPPEMKDADAPKTYKCPQCGATTQYDVAAGGVACEHCGYVLETQSAAVGVAAEQFEFTLEALGKAAHGWGVDRKELHCDACGATIALAENALTATCPFCASNKVVVRAAAGDQLRPRVIVPFKIQPEALRARVADWLGRGWFHPAGLAAAASVDKFAGIYLPFWTFDANIASRWKAEVGYEHTERYYDSSDKEWKTRTVIRWKWEDGQVRVAVDDLLIAGTARVSRLLLERLYPFDLRALVEYSPDYLAGWQAQAYDVALPEAWEQGKAAMRERAKDACRADIHSHHVRNLSVTADFGDESWRYLLLPVYVAAYRFEAKTFQVMVNGQSGAVAGQKPVAWWKIWLAMAALLAPGLCLGLVGLPLLLAGGAGFPVLIVAFIGLVIGGVISFFLYQKAQASEAA